MNAARCAGSAHALGRAVGNSLTKAMTIAALAVLSGCATHGVSMTVAGQDAVQLGAGSDQLPSGDVDFFTLSPMDTVQIYVMPRRLDDPGARLDYGSQVHVTLSFDSSQNYGIMPGDKLSIRNESEPDKVWPAEVRPDGYITLPQIGREVHAAGETPTHLATLISHLYAGVMIAPRISVIVEQSSIDQAMRVNGNYPVNFDGRVQLPMLGSFVAAGRTSQDLERDIRAAVQQAFHSPFKVSVAPAQVTGRDADPRVDPDGQQYFRGTVKIAPDGSVVLPGAGTLTAAGITLSELRKSIIDRLQPSYQNPIDVSVSLIESGNLSVFIGGEVRQPGRYPYVRSLTLLQLLAASGWINEWGDLENATLLHRDASGRFIVYHANLRDAIDGKSADEDLKLSPRDVVIVPRTGIAKVDLWIDQYIRKFLPINLNAGYSYGQGDFASTVKQ